MLTPKLKHLPELAAGAGATAALASIILPFLKSPEGQVVITVLCIFLTAMGGVVLCTVSLVAAFIAFIDPHTSSDGNLYLLGITSSAIGYALFFIIFRLTESISINPMILVTYWLVVTVYFVVLRLIRGPVG